MNALGAYLELTKPRLLPLVLFSGFPAIWLATRGPLDGWNAGLVLLGISLAAGAANALNSYLERDVDRHMARTASRPLPSGRLTPGSALTFGLSLGVLGPLVLWQVGGVLAALVALAGILFYVFIYTLWLKPRTPAAVIVGGVSGAIAPLIADAAVHGSIGPAGWLLFAIVFVWQPPHFWAIALFRQAEYERAGFPLLPSRAGGDRTRTRILRWIGLLIPISLLPVWLTDLSGVYACGAASLGAWFLWSGVALRRERSREAARRLFRVSLVYLIGIFGSMLLDLGTAAGVYAATQGSGLRALDLSFLPAVNASLNAVATGLLIWGRALIRTGRRDLHRRVMLGAFATSSLFLVLYVLHKASRNFENTSYNVEWAQPIYLAILASHVLLAMTVPVLALVLIRLGWTGRFDSHRSLARIAWPVWLYVSVTGVVIYVMLYHLNVSPA